MEAFESRRGRRPFGALPDATAAPQGAAFHRRRGAELRALAENIDDTEARIGVLRLAEHHDKAANTLERLSPTSP